MQSNEMIPDSNQQENLSDAANGDAALSAELDVLTCITGLRILSDRAKDGDQEAVDLLTEVFAQIEAAARACGIEPLES